MRGHGGSSDEPQLEDLGSDNLEDSDGKSSESNSSSGESDSKSKQEISVSNEKVMDEA